MTIELSQVLSKDRFGLYLLQQNIRRRQRRGQPVERMQMKLTALYTQSHEAYCARLSALPKAKLEADLPVLAAQAEIKAAIAKHQVVIISGETGSGKTTQLPQLCLDLGLGARGLIGHTQPRRIAARSVAERIAEELEVALGQAVGYQVRFDEKTSADTVIKLMTDGMLLAETLADKFLANYEVIIVDEAHERSLNIDFLLGYLHQLLPKRPDLKVIITSATIDSDKFAKHFHDAPQINVSGRTYPVAVRYRPLVEEDDSNQALVEAVAELDHLGRGDVLVFLPTERDIREAAEVLSGAQLRDTAVLPLFGRLSLADQQAVFRPKAQRRIVLATNVAETSLTVPRIKYVIDTGTARISRYSLRTKTQRLPIEAISQASANQRAGRCGRTSAGVCLRLYSEEDFKQRPEFTEPEILRTNLAAVILQMLALRLGAVGDFPFVDSPDQRQINDGYRLLFELKAVDERQRLTALGRKMAQLPIDPRFARIAFEAARLGALEECLTLLAALSIQDPRERPFGKEQQADDKQRQFADKRSDFQSLLNVYHAYEKKRSELSNNKRRQWCRAHFLNPQRMREWRELRRQLARDCSQQGLRFNQQPAHIDTIHRALLAGFIDQVGLWDEQNQQYNGPRNRKFHIFPGSVLAKKPPQAVMAAHIVEIHRVFARSCAPINLHELEHIAAHLLKYSYSEPHWSKKAGNVMAGESALLYGLPISAGRKVPFAPQDPALAHDIFVQEALITGEIQTKLRVIGDNIALFNELQILEDKTRSRGILIDEQTMAEFYFSRLPESVHSVVSLEQWANKHGVARLKMTRNDLLTDPLKLSKQDYPEQINVRGHQLKLDYVFNPGGEADGVTVLMPITALNSFDAQDFDDLVPAMFAEKVEAILRRLPKVWRRQLVPIPDFTRAIVERMADVTESLPLITRIRHAIKAIKGINIPDSDFDLNKIDDHYRMNIRLIDHKQRTIGEGRDLLALQNQYSQQAAKQFQRRSHSRLSDSQAVTEWTWETLPQQERMSGGLIGYPALTVEDAQLFLRLHDDPQRAQYAHHEGVLTLLSDKLKQPIKYLRKNMPNFTQMSLHYRKISDDVHLFDDVISALIERVCLSDGIPRSQSQFDHALAQGEKNLVATASELSQQLADILSAYSDINQRLRRLKHRSAKQDIDTQLARLIFPNFIRHTPAKRLAHLLRYLQAINARLDKLDHEPLRDLPRQQTIAPWQDKLNALLQTENIERPQQLGLHGQGKHPEKRQAVLDYFYLLEEYRVSIFAQEIGTGEKVSAKRLESAYEGCL